MKQALRHPNKLCTTKGRRMTDQSSPSEMKTEELVTKDCVQKDTLQFISFNLLLNSQGIFFPMSS